MSNNYKSTLQSNNTDLQAILNTINELPEAVEQVTPVISVSSNGLITATAGAKTSTHQLAFQAAKTITPTTTSQTAVSSGYYTGGNITVKGDANLVAGNIKSGVSIFGVNGTYAGSGGDTSVEDSLIMHTVSGTYTNNRVTTIDEFVFGYCSNLTSVNFPACTSIGGSAFKYCSNLTSVNFPACTSIGSYAFQHCSKLTSISFPKVTSIGGSAFQNCSNLTSVNFPVCTTISVSAFQGCSKLTSISFPKVTSIGGTAFKYCYNLTSISFPVCTTISVSAFEYCSNLTSVNFPVCTTISVSAFQSCSKLTSISFPACTSIGGSAFERCSKLTSISFPKVTSIGSYAFRYCYNLKSLYLTGSSVCKLSASNAFSGTPIGGYSTYAGTYGSIYVPTSLLTSYKAATNWTYFSSRFVGI